MKKQLNKYLDSLSKEDLEKEIKKLYATFKEVKNFYDMELSDDRTNIIESFKKRIKTEYFPARGYGKARSAESLKVVQEFKKIAVSKKDIIELLLYRVEQMVAFTRAYGDMPIPFYDSMCNSFGDAIALMNQEKLVKEFKHTCEELRDKCAIFGYGVEDFMSDLLDELRGE